MRTVHPKHLAKTFYTVLRIYSPSKCNIDLDKLAVLIRHDWRTIITGGLNRVHSNSMLYKIIFL